MPAAKRMDYPRDIRPDFDDLAAAASLHAFAYLFEAKTVLGLPSRRVVEEAWRFDQLADVQERYCSVVEQNLDRLKSKRHSAEELATLMRMALNAYHSAMVKDPLLPRALHPGDYQGRRVLSLHRCLFEEINHQH